MIGIGATIGTGIFFVLSQAVPVAGPAVIWSFIIAGVVAGLTAVCYAELASAVPVSGSSYSYAYATLGEIVAMGVAACLLLEYGVSAAAVAVGWSEYVNQLLGNLFGAQIPDSLSQSPEGGGWFNLPAVVLVLLVALLLIRGVSESAKVNATMVMIKIGVLVMLVVIGLFGWNSDNLAAFAPFGLAGVTSAAGIIFFSYIGLDAVSTAGEEVHNPRRTLPLAIIIALVTVTTLYVAVAIVAVAAQPAAEFEGQEAGLAAILENITGSAWPGSVLAAGAIISIFSVTLVVIYGQTRILFAMGRDGMLPELFHKVNPRTLTPVNSTIIVAVVVALLAGLLPIEFLAEMTSIGTLVAFLVVSIGVIVLRRTAPDLPRGFKVPGYPVVPVLSVLGCIWIIIDLRPVTIIAFAVWVAVAMIWYFVYGIRHSRLRDTGAPREVER
jgi:amino acid transporter